MPISFAPARRGRGSVVNSLFGVLVISVLETGLAQLGAQEPVKRLVTGGVIVAAVIVDFYPASGAARRAIVLIPGFESTVQADLK